MAKFLNISIDDTLGGNSPSDDKISSEKATKGYIDNNILSVNTRLDKGNLGTADPLTDSTSYGRIKYYYDNPSFGKSKFLQPSSSNLTIVDGVVSGFTSDSYLYTIGKLPASYDTFELYLGKFKFSEWANEWMITNAKPISTGGFMIRPNVSSSIVLFYLWLASGTSSWDIASSVHGDSNLVNHINDLDKDIELKLTFDGSKYVLYSNIDGGGWTQEIEVVSSAKILGDLSFYYGAISSSTHFSADLKPVKIIADNAVIFSSEQTGIDTYDLAGVITNIPYKVTQIGRIVDSVYRTNVNSVYSTFGYAPY